MIFETNWWTYDLDTIVLDLNWTLTVGGVINDSTKVIIDQLMQNKWKLYLLTWNQRWNAGEFESLWIEVIIAKNSEEKADFMKTLNSDNVVSIWNARIDIWMFKNSSISIATLQSEWIHTWILWHVDILVPSIDDALYLFLDSNRFAATMNI